MKLSGKLLLWFSWPVWIWIEVNGVWPLGRETIADVEALRSSLPRVSFKLAHPSSPPALT